MGADAAIRLGVELLGGPDEHRSAPIQLEVAILDRARARRAFRRIDGRRARAHRSPD